MLIATLCAAAGLSLVHIFAGHLRFLDVIPRSGWLSFAGGISVAYVILHLLPELGEAQEVVDEAAGGILGALENHVYLLVLLGLTMFYGLERAAKQSRDSREESGGKDQTEPAVFWLHIASFAIYNAIIGYLLVERETLLALAVFFIAMALHFVVNDYGLREHHKDAYDRIGRWVIAAAVFAGWTLGVTFEVPETVLFIPVAFIGGGVILNVLKEELPEERESRFGAFALGVVAYSALLLAL